MCSNLNRQERSTAQFSDFIYLRQAYHFMLIRSLVLFLVLKYGSIHAQNYVDILKLYYNTTSRNQHEGTGSGTRIDEAGAELTYPIVLSTSTAIYTGLAIESVNLKIFPYADYSTLSAYSLRLGFNKKHSDRLSGTYLVIPKLASDFRESSSHNFQVGFFGLLKFTKHKNFNYKLGLYYNTELFGPFVAPIFGLYYLNPTKRFEANLLLPSTVDLNYRIQDWLNAGISFNGQLKSFRLSELPSLPTVGYVVKTSNEICTYLKFNFTPELSLLTKVGHSVGRSYRVYEENDKIDLGISLIKIGNDRTLLNTEIADGTVYQATLLYRFIQK